MSTATVAVKTNHNQVYLYFGTMIFLIGIVNPTYYTTDIATSFMLKDQLHLSASAVSIFRAVTPLPVYAAFLFGLIRDRWSPFGLRDRGLYILFGPVTALIFFMLAHTKLTLASMYIGIFLLMASSRFVIAAYQGLIALVGQEKLMSGRLAVVWNSVLMIPVAIGAVGGGWMADHLKPDQSFTILAVLMLLVGALGFWKPASVFNHAYDQPQAQTTTLGDDVRRLLKHKAIYPAVIIMLLWNFAPGSNTPLQYYLTNHLHTSDQTYGYFNAIFALTFIPTFLVFAFLCKRVPLSKLLWWGTIIAIPQLVPLLFIRSATGALVLAVPIGLMGGVATAAYYDLAMRSCPPGLQGTLMLMVDAGYWLAQRLGDILGSKIYESNEKYGFLYCVISICIVYALILPCILWVPKHLIATPDGEPNSEPSLEQIPA